MGTLHVNVSFYRVTYTFQSESTLYSCVNFKELLVRNSRNIWSLSDCKETRTHNHLLRKRTLNHLAKLTKWLGWVGSTYLYGAFDLPSYHVTYAFQREFTLYIRLDAKELLAQNRRDIWNLSDCKETRTHNQLFRKRTLNHLVKLTRWLSWVVSTISVRCIWLYLLIVSRTHFRPSPEFIFAWMLRNSLLQTVAISEI